VSAALRVLALALVLVVASGPGLARAAGPIGSLDEARAYFSAGDYYKAAELAAPLLEDESLSRSDRGEAYRIYGLALFFLGRRDEADAALFEWLKLEPDARIHPALVPAEGLAFLEVVRSRHARELDQYRPHPKRHGYAVVRLLPPFAQIQNGEPGKAWTFGITEGLLASTALASWITLRFGWCNQQDLTCAHSDTAKTLRLVNWSSLFALGVVVGIGAWDGDKVWHEQGRAQGFEASRTRFGLMLGEGEGGGGAGITWGGSF
jgi:tetratricopeptide (TPR) repeat protein